MELRFLHLYPDLMNLYGSYANVTVLARLLRRAGHTVEVQPVLPGEDADIASADFLYLGAGTERRQRAAMADLRRLRDAVLGRARDGGVTLFVGTAMELLGRSVTTAAGDTYDGLGLADFSTVQAPRRMLGDVLGTTKLYPEPVAGFLNKSGVIKGVETPLLSTLAMGFGNERDGGPEGFHRDNVFASELTGPILVKNPRLLETVAAAILLRRGAFPPEAWPSDAWAEKGYAVTVRELRRRVS